MQAQLSDDARRLLRALDVVVWRMAPRTLRITRVDCGAERLGFSPEQWTTQPDFYARLLHPEERQLTLGLVRATARDGRERQFTHRVVADDGRSLWFRTRVMADTDASGRVRRLLGVMLDITERVSAESSLRDEHTRLRLVVEQLPAIVFTTDRELRFTSGVGAGLAELGLRSDAVLVGTSVQEYLHIDDPHDPVLVAFRRALAGAKVTYEMPWLGGRWYQTHVEPFHDVEGRLVGTMAVSWNITERKRAEDALRLLARASAALAESLDYDETLGKVTRLAVPDLADWCMLGVLENRVLRMVAAAHVDRDRERLFDVMRPTSLDALGDIGRVVREGRPILVSEITDPMIAPGSAIPLPPGEEGVRVAEAVRALGLRSLIAVPLVTRGHTLGAFVLARAAEGRSYGPADLAVAEDLARRCATAIDNALLYRTAQKAIESRDEFLSIASHELRTPLTSMLLRLESLQRKNAGLDVVVRQSRRLANLIEQLLDVSRIQRGRLELVTEVVDLGDVVRTVVGRTETDLARAGCAVSIAETGQVTGVWDRLRLEQVVTNLLSNAVKFAPGSKIDIEVNADATGARLLVRDYGPGVAPEDRERIFERFERGANRHRPGMGLGLYITRQIVEAHAGTIHVESTPGRGSTFVVDLPRWPAADREPPQHE